MAERIPPPWEGDASDAAVPVATTPLAPGRWTKGMRSPNPNGRPRGVVDRRTKITQALMDDGLAIVRVVTDAAKEGDLQACSIVLSRIAPALKPEGTPVQFAFDPAAPVSAQVAQVLEAMASGSLSPDVAKVVIDSLKALLDVRAFEELDARLTALEERR